MPRAPRDEDVVVTGMGVCTAWGMGADALADGLRQSRPAPLSNNSFLLRDFDLVSICRSLRLSEDPAPAVRRAARAPLSLQVSLACALEAWQGARLFGDTGCAPERISLVVAGNNLNPRVSFELAEKYRSRLDYLPASHALHFLDTDHVGFISEVLGIRGEGFTVGGASASGNCGLIQGMRQIACHGAAICLVLGAMTDLSPLELQSFAAAGAMAVDGVCRPFDRDRHGFVYGQGCACLVLESASGARRRGCSPLAVLLGAAQCLAANRSSEPSQDAEARAMCLSLEAAGALPSEVDYVNTHGTASLLGDLVEFHALREVFGDRLAHVRLNSTKSLIGHCLSGAGVVEAAATVIQMRQGFLHGTAGLENPLAAGGGFVGPAAIEARPRLALSNSFGFGGINTSIAIGYS